LETSEKYWQRAIFVLKMIASVTFTDQRWGLTAPSNMMLTFMLPTLGGLQLVSMKLFNSQLAYAEKFSEVFRNHTKEGVLESSNHSQ
jgi:hypothetical protein